MREAATVGDRCSIDSVINCSVDLPFGDMDWIVAARSIWPTPTEIKASTPPL